ncbi:MAG: SET domain-containing protein, partial [Candidatus Pacearchaeota archaeon]
MVSQENLQIIKSKIAGAGVMTKVPIKKGSTILILSGEVISLNEMSKRVDNDEEEGSDPLGIDWEVYMDLDPLPRTFNHSCNPNAYIKGKNKLVALRDIK